MRLLRLLVLTGAAVLTTPSSASADDARIGSWGIDLTGLDRSVSPGTDFDRFANGIWLDRTTIPPDRQEYGLFRNLSTDADLRSRALLEAVPVGIGAPVESPGKAATLYRSFLDQTAVDRRGAAAARAMLEPIRSARSPNELATLMGRSFAGFGASFVDLEFGADHVDGRGYQLIIQQDGLRIAREYYLDPRFSDRLAAYHRYAAGLLALAGWADPDRAADRIVELERKIAAASMPEAETRDPVKSLNPVTASDLTRRAPGFPWTAFLSGAGIDGGIRLNLATPESVAALGRLFGTTSVRAMRDWLAFRTLDHAAPYLSAAFVDERFSFAKASGGAPALAPRWKRGIDLVNDMMGSALGQLYVAKYFTPTSQAVMEALVGRVREAFATSIGNATWISGEGRNEALRKLAALEVQVGAPRVPIDYAGLVVRSDDLPGNVLRARAFEWTRRVRQAHGAWNKSDWRFWPQDPTAYNENRQLIFTAAMLQAPFFDPNADPAVNYGAIGAVIGHEISHNFDDQGRAIDADGRQRDWWTPGDAAHFQVQASRLSAQFSRMEPLPGTHVDGLLTLGENIADLAGLEVALQAYHASLEGRAPPVLEGLTGDQRFILSWAQAWREKIRPGRLRDLLLTDVHSPAAARVNGPLANMDGWYAAWAVRPGDKAYIPRGERVRFW